MRASGISFVFLCFFETKKKICSHTNWTYAGGQVLKKFAPGRKPETRLLFFDLGGTLEVSDSILLNITKHQYE